MNKKTEKLIAALWVILTAKGFVSESQLDELKELIHSDEDLTEEWTTKVMGVLITWVK